MKLADITQKSDKELATLITEQRQKLAQARTDLRTKQGGNVKEILALRKTVARVLTVQRQRQLTKEVANG